MWLEDKRKWVNKWLEHDELVLVSPLICKSDILPVFNPKLLNRDYQLSRLIQISFLALFQMVEASEISPKYSQALITFHKLIITNAAMI